MYLSSFLHKQVFYLIYVHNFVLKIYKKNKNQYLHFKIPKMLVLYLETLLEHLNISMLCSDVIIRSLQLLSIIFKGIVHPQMKIMSSLSSCSKPANFVFSSTTQKKTF